LPAGTSGRAGNREEEIKDDFYLGKFEVTQGEWEAVMGHNPSQHSRTGNLKDAVKDVPDAELSRFPVENVSWEGAQQFLTRLNGREKGSGWTYRLPTEVEWEYACRGGPSADKGDDTCDFYAGRPGNQLGPDRANIMYQLRRTCKVGSYPPNRLGLHDMHGNVYEWCAEVDAFRGVASRRGGGYGHQPHECRAAQHGALGKTLGAHDCGLRVARVPTHEESK
jgi:formylglycine-generating enzyme required for sulfatase activity